MRDRIYKSSRLVLKDNGEKMKFSIAIPVYGQEQFLRFALDSICIQTPDVQIAVMDATPDDRVQAVLEKYRKRLHYQRHGRDSGQTAAIQEGWDHTDGEIIAWLCADDYLFPDALAAVKNVFLSHPDVDVVYGDSVFVNEHDHFIGYFPAISDDMSNILKGCCISQPSCFVRRTAFDAIGRLNPDLHYIMDWDLWTRLYHSGAKFHYLNKPLSVVRMHQMTKTASRSRRRYVEIARHLWSNTTKSAMVKSLIGFYHQDLLSVPSTGYESILLKFLNFYRHQKHKYQKTRGVNGRYNYGLSSYRNEAKNTIDVFMPWYNEHAPATLRIGCDLRTPPEVYLNTLSLSASSSGTRFSYSVPQIDLSSHLLHLQVSPPVDLPWHLQVVEFHDGTSNNQKVKKI